MWNIEACRSPHQVVPSLLLLWDTLNSDGAINIQGHLEFFICNADDLRDGPDGVVTQGCFNMHPLDRADDDGDASPIDPNYKGRYYVDPPCVASERDQSMVPGAYAGDVVTARYQLPEGLTCERCVVQMVYCESHPRAVIMG